MKKVFLGLLVVLSGLMISMDSSKLAKRKIYEGVSILMPEDFVVMSDNDIATKYPSTKKPLAMFMSSDTKADFSMNNTKAKFAGQDAKMLHEIYKATIMDTYDTTTVKGQDPFKRDRIKRSFKFLNEGVKTVNKKEYAYFEYTSEFDNIRKYNYIMYTTHKKHVLIFNFSCDQRAMNVYQPIANSMMASVKVSSKLSLPDYTLEQNNQVPRKRQSVQDVQEMLIKSKTKTKK